jgi:hypothetical protein
MADALPRCAHLGCYRFAVVPPKGYALNLPVCFAHIKHWDSVLYAKDIQELLDSESLSYEAKCAFCGFVAFGKNVAQLPCCGAYICCGGRGGRGDSDLSDEEKILREKYSPVRWFAPWEYVEEIARGVPINHPDQLDIYEVCYLKVVEKGLDIAKKIELVKKNLGKYQIGTKSELFREEARRAKEEFDALYSFYEELLVKLGVNTNITPSFVPTVVYDAFSSIYSEGR